MSEPSATAEESYEEPSEARPGQAWLWAMTPANHAVFSRTGTFAIRRNGRASLERVRPGDLLFVYLSGSKVIAGLYEATSAAFEDTTPLVAGAHYPYRIRVRPLIRLPEEAWVPYDAFHDKLGVSDEYPDFGAVVRQVLHALPRVDEKVLAFLVRARSADMEQAMAALEELRQLRREERATPALVREERLRYTVPASFDRPAAMRRLIDGIEARGYIYAPWQIAAYVTALRTKPFVILAGVTGIGKSRLPELVARATRAAIHIEPVRPDWTDSSEVLGYVDLQGRFRPGVVLRHIREAAEAPRRAHVMVLDEMNVARVEQYLAEVLSRIEARRPASEGAGTPPLVGIELPREAEHWAQLGLPANLALVGTVNMDESAHTFSRKVLDRAFTLELADVDLLPWRGPAGDLPDPEPWPAAAWQPRAVRLAELDADASDRDLIERVSALLEEANAYLRPAQLQVAYRTRDEIALFALHAAETPEAFRTRSGEAVDPLDLAFQMRLLPRLLGGSRPVRRAVLGLLGWATTGEGLTDEAEAREVVQTWDKAGAPEVLPSARFPRTAARLCLMTDRLLTEGFTSYWV